MIAYTDFVEGHINILKAVTQQALNANCHCYSSTPLNIVVDMTMITSINMQAINCRCSPTRVTNSSILYKSQRHMHINASISLSIKLIIRLMLVGMPAWKRRAEIQNLPLNSVFQHQSMEVYSHHVVICTLVMLANVKF